MGNLADDKKNRKRPLDYEVAAWIAGLPEKPIMKYFLTRVWHHQNYRKGFAWISQEKLAWEMKVSLSTVERLFARAKKRELIIVRPVHTGPQTQHNEFWLNFDWIRTLQRPPYDPSPVKGQKNADPAPVKGQASDVDPAPVMPMTRQIELDDPSNGAGRPSTSDGGVFEVKQLMSNAVKEVQLDAAQTAAGRGQNESAKITRDEVSRGEAKSTPLSMPASPEKPNGQPEPKPEPEPESYPSQQTSDGLSAACLRDREFYQRAMLFGWTQPYDLQSKRHIKIFLSTHYGVTSPRHLTPLQYREAMNRLALGPPVNPYCRENVTAVLVHNRPN